MAKNKKDIIYYLANKHEIPIKKIEEAINYQFKFVSYIMSLGKFESVRLPYFGKFSVNKKRVEHITKLKEKKDGLK
jgi:nucleoid DNA-binding protein